MKRNFAHTMFSVATALLMLFTALPREWYHHCEHEKAKTETGVSAQQHDCPVCDYVFLTSFLLENDLQVAEASVNFEPNFPIYLSVSFNEIALSNGLRGPPSA